MKQTVSLSGGRDSTAMLLLMIEKGEQIDDVVFFDWGHEYPEMRIHLEKLESFTGMTITRLYPDHDWEFYRDEYIRKKGAWKGVKGYGLPQAGRAWCTAIKRNAIAKYTGERRGESTACIGYAYEEKQRAKYLPNQRYPLLEWGVHSLEAYEYCKARGFYWGGLYEVWARVSCSCCPFKRRLPQREKRGYVNE